MPIGGITPGSFCTVTPDSGGVFYASVQAPTATMLVKGEHLQALTLVVLNIQEKIENGSWSINGDLTFEAGSSLTFDNAVVNVTNASEFHFDSGTLLDVNGSAAFSDGVDFEFGCIVTVKGLAGVTFDSTAALTMASGSSVNFNGQNLYPDPQRPADAATITISDITHESIVILPTPVGSNHVVIVNNASEGKRLELALPPGLGDGKQFIVKRADATVIAELWVYTAVNGLSGSSDAAGIPSSITIQVESGVWRGMKSSGYIVTGAGW